MLVIVFVVPLVAATATLAVDADSLVNVLYSAALPALTVAVAISDDPPTDLASLVSVVAMSLFALALSVALISGCNEIGLLASVNILMSLISLLFSSMITSATPFSFPTRPA